MSEKPLTRRQGEILKFISEHIDQQGLPPTRHEVARHFGFRSPNAAESHLRALAKKGVIELDRGRSRGITLTALSAANLPPASQPHRALPLVGRVAAGSRTVRYRWWGASPPAARSWPRKTSSTNTGWTRRFSGRALITCCGLPA